MNLIWFHYAVILSYGLDNHFRLSVRSSVAPTQLLCVGNIMQFTLDCIINRQWRGMFSVQSGVGDSVYVCVLVTMRQRPLGWNNVWLGVCACVGVKPWFINVGFSTTWAHSSSSTHCNATGTHTHAARPKDNEVRLSGDWPQTLIKTIPGTKSALIDWLRTHSVSMTWADRNI